MSKLNLLFTVIILSSSLGFAKVNRVISCQGFSKTTSGAAIQVNINGEVIGTAKDSKLSGNFSYVAWHPRSDQSVKTAPAEPRTNSCLFMQVHKKNNPNYGVTRLVKYRNHSQFKFIAHNKLSLKNGNCNGITNSAEAYILFPNEIFDKKDLLKTTLGGKKYEGFTGRAILSHIGDHAGASLKLRCTVR